MTKSPSIATSSPRPASRRSSRAIELERRTGSHRRRGAGRPRCRRESGAHRRAGDGVRAGSDAQRGIARLDLPSADARHAARARRRRAADGAGTEGADVSVSHQEARTAGGVRFRRHRGRDRTSLPACNASSRSSRASCTSRCAAIRISNCSSAAPVTGVTQTSRRRGHDRTRRPKRETLRPLPDRRRRREQRGAPVARHRVRGLHLAGPVAGRLDAVRLP